MNFLNNTLTKYFFCLKLFPNRMRSSHTDFCLTGVTGINPIFSNKNANHNIKGIHHV